MAGQNRHEIEVCYVYYVLLGGDTNIEGFFE